MSNDINVKVKIDSNTKQETQDAKALNKQLKEAQVNAASVSKAASQTKAFASAQRQAASSTENIEYGITRSMAGTGAAGRDFAKQAQGMGGLVHVYATFAANIFAVGAAFTALKNAADTTNMVKGLDQLGAASGRGLGTLSKEIVALTDGAVTLREAMEATAKATAAGMSSADLKRLATGAKNASQALGVDMSDALSRLSRGITKLEPELLDELGIFVRVDKAASDYARTLGKPATALTDFEKRAAFAAATLTQVEQKFGAIKIDSNPYNQLGASLSQVMQTGLELINTVATPILRLLSSSPTALAVSIGMVGTALLKQAIPALGSFKESMRAASEQTTKLANIKNVEAMQAKRAILKEKELFLESKIEDQISNVMKAENKLADLRDSHLNKNTAAYKILKKAEEDVLRIKEEDYQAVEKAAKRAESKGDVDKAKVYREVAESVRANVAAENDLAIAKEKNAQEMVKEVSRFSTLGMVQAATNKANLKAVQQQIVSNAAYTASMVGPIEAFKKLSSQIAEARSGASTLEIKMPQFDAKTGLPMLDEQGKQITKLETITTGKLGKIAAGWTMLKGTVGIATTAIGTAVNAFGTYAAVIAAVGAVLSIVIDKFSATSKESKATADAMQALTASSENAERVLTRLRDLDPLARFTVENVQARATALTELASAFTTGINRVYDEMQKMNALDKTVDFFKNLFNADVADNLADNISEGIVYAFKLAGEGSASKQAEASIKRILGDVDLKDEAALKSALEPLIKGGPAAKLQVQEVQKSIQRLAQETGSAAARGTELQDAMKLTGKAFQDVANSFIPSDNISKLGMSLIAESEKFSLAIEDPKQKLLALRGILENPVQMSLLPEGTRDELLKNTDALEGLINQSAAYTSLIEETTTELENMYKLQAELERQGPFSDADMQLGHVNDKIAKLTETIDQYKDTKLVIEAEVKSKTGINLADVGTQMFQKGAELVGNRLSAEFAKAGTIITKAAASLAPDTISGIKLSTGADQAQLDIEKKMITVQMTLVKSMYDLKQSQDLANLLKQKEFEKDASKIPALDASIERLQKGIAAAGEKGFAGSPGALQELASQGVDSATIQLATQLLSMKAELGAKSAQQAANAIAEQGKLIDQRANNQAKELESVKEINRLDLERLSSIRGADGLISNQLLARKQSLELSTAQADADAKVVKTQADLDKFMLMYNTAKLKGGEQAEKDKTSLENALKLAKSNKDVALETLKAKQKYDMESNAIAREKQLLDLEVQRTGAISSLGILSDSETVRMQAQLEMRNLLSQQELDAGNLRFQLNKAIAAQEATTDAAKRASLQQTIDAIRQEQVEQDNVYAKRVQTLEVMNRVKIVQSETNELATSLNAIFTGMNNTVGEFASVTIKAFESMKQAANDYAIQMAEINKKKTEVQTNDKLPEEDRKDKLKDLAAEESRLKKKAVKDELTGNAAILGSAKKLFNEKSTSYKILATVEKAMHMARLAMMAAEIMQQGIAAVQYITMSEAEQAAANSKMVAKAGSAIAGQGEGDPYTAPIRIAAMIALMTAVIAAFGSGGGGGASVSVPSFPTSDQLQEVQGTGQDYQQGTMNLLSNGGGVLGDIKAKSEDIANSIDYIESHTFDTLVYNNKMLAALKGIEVNTSEFVASLAQAGIVGITSPFGTQNTSSGGGSGGFLGIGGSSSSTSREVTDFGVKITGALGELAKGVGKYLVYETVKTVSSWSSSGFWGIGGGSGTNTSYNTEYRNLNDDVITTLRALFVNASDFVIASGEVLGGRTQAELQRIIDNTQINLDVSTFDLTGEEALADVMAEIGIEMNKIVEVAYPFLLEFQRLGEGLSTTLARVTNDMQTVDVMFAQMGVNFAEKFLIPADDVIAQNRLADEKIATAQQKIQDARAALEYKRITGYGLQLGTMYDEWGQEVSGYVERPLAAMFTNVEDYIRGLEAQSNMDTAYTGWWGSYGTDPDKVAIRDAARATLADYYAAIQSEADAINNRRFDIPLANTRVYEDLINRFGGDVQTFVDKTQFYIDNFIDENTVLMAHYDAVTTELNRLQSKYPDIAIATVDTRQEFSTLVSSLDLATESGRQLYVELMNLAPGFDVIANHLEDLISKAGLSVDDFTNTLLDGIQGNLTNTDIGATIADTIYDGIMSTMSRGIVENISNTLVQYVITPVVSAASTGAAIVGAVSAQTIQTVRNIAVANARVLTELFSDQEFISALRTMSNQIGDIVQSFSDISLEDSNAQLAASTKAVQDLISKVGLAATNFGSILKDAIVGNITVTEIGTKVATMIQDGILNAIAESYINTVTDSIVTNIITPVITALTTGATVSAAVSSAAIDEVRVAAGRAALAISTVFSDPLLVSTIANISTTIADSMKVMAATTQVSSGSISKIITKTNAKIVDAYKKQASELSSTINKLKGFSDSLKEFRDSLLTGNLSPLTPLQKYNKALEDLNKTYAAAQSGDEDALARLKTVAQTFLDMSSEYYASSDSYVTDFNRVQTMLSDAITSVDSQVTIYQQQLDAANAQLTRLGSMDDSLKSIEQLLAEAQAIQKEEIANILSGGFVGLDRNLDSLLSLDELKASGLASDSELRQVYQMLDTNSDGQISAIEALQASTEGTTYSVTSLSPLLAKVYDGTVSIEQAIRYLASINQANVEAGGAPIAIDWSTFRPSGGGSGGNGGVGYAGGFENLSFLSAQDVAFWNTEMLQGRQTAATVLNSILESELNSNNQEAVAWVTEYIQGAYRKVLGREGEASGVTGWVDAIKTGNVKINDLYSVFADSEEALNKGVTNLEDYITRAYETVLGRRPDTEGLLFWRNAIESGQTHIQDLYDIFQSSDEYITNVRDQIFRMLGDTSGNQVTGTVDWQNTQYENLLGIARAQVQQGYRDILGREADTGGLQYWTQQILSGSMGIEELYNYLAKSDEAVSRATRARVDDLDGYITRAYTLLLDRAPDTEGFNYWKQAIESNSMSITDLYATFATSDEYLNRMQRVVTTFNEIMASVGDGSISRASGTLVPTGTNTGANSNSINSAVTSAYSNILNRGADTGGLAWWTGQINSGALALSDLNMSLARTAAAQQTTADALAAKSWLHSQGVPGYALGGYHSGGLRVVGENGPELEATGEARIWTATQTRNMLSGIANRNNYNGDLIAEIQKLNAKIESLEQTVQQGDIMNAQATERNTQQVSGSIKDTTSKAVYTNKLQTRAAIV